MKKNILSYITLISLIISSCDKDTELLTIPEEIITEIANTAANAPANAVQSQIESALASNTANEPIVNSDIYTMPFNSLNFTFEKKIGSSKNQTFRIRVKNILNNTQRSEFISYQAGLNYFQNKLSIGRSLSIGYGINL